MLVPGAVCGGRKTALAVYVGLMRKKTVIATSSAVTLANNRRILFFRSSTAVTAIKSSSRPSGVLLSSLLVETAVGDERVSA
jgi:hypothetical protein